LGVPQGSVLGPLFFLLFINDLAFYLDQFKCIMFADDTTLYKSDQSYTKLVSKFSRDISSLQDWCEHNHIDVNWSKTFIMFVTNKRISPPNELTLNANVIEVVLNFKLLGVTIDNKLNFNKFTSELRNKIIQKMYSIKKLFQLSSSVKTQFFKTFILPYFDYCSTLSIYYAKTAIQRMCNCYNLCLLKLFKLKNISQTNIELNNYNNKLESRGLNTFEHRTTLKMATFIHKIVNNSNTATELKNSLQSNQQVPKMQTLRQKFQNQRPDQINTLFSRHSNALLIPKVSGKHGELTFSYFFTRFINLLLLDDINLRYSFFKTRILNNINLIFTKFIVSFPKFDVKNKNFDYLNQNCKKQ
jgi:hypothetical protein